MKNIFNFLMAGLCLLIFSTGNAQISTPAASQGAKLETTVGLTSMVVEYSRPNKKGRKIFGDLVPYNAIWRTGANANTKITFGDDVKIGGSNLKKGSYAIYTKPGASSWEVYFYTDTDNHGNPEKWEDSKVAAKVMVTPKTISPIETFTINIGNLTNSSCDLEISWDNLLVPVSIEVPTDKKVSASITKVMAGPSAGDYYNSAVYYRESKKDLNQALAWMNKSIEMGNDKFWIYRQKSLIEADMGNYKAAIESAKISLTKATEAKSTDYIKLNNDSINMWSKK